MPPRISQTKTPLDQILFYGSRGTTTDYTVCVIGVKRVMTTSRRWAHPLVVAWGHEDICTQRSSRDVATAVHIFRCKSRRSEHISGIEWANRGNTITSDAPQSIH
jgi:hypothetical protein